MPVFFAIGLCLALAGCAATTESRSLSYGDYVGFTCEQLGQEAVRLMRATTSRSEHLLENDQARRDNAMHQLKAVKQASAYNRC
jgi:hypothetical protein